MIIGRGPILLVRALGNYGHGGSRLAWLTGGAGARGLGAVSACAAGRGGKAIDSGCAAHNTSGRSDSGPVRPGSSWSNTAFRDAQTSRSLRIALLHSVSRSAVRYPAATLPVRDARRSRRGFVVARFLDWMSVLPNLRHARDRLDWEAFPSGRNPHRRSRSG